MLLKTVKLVAIEKYTTKALILNEYEQGESDKVYKLFTREFGVVFALAKSVRKLESKLRFHLEKTKKVSVTLVEGKEVWRLTGVEPSMEDCHEGAIVTRLIERFVPGVGAQKKLFDHAEEYMILSTKEIPKDIRTLTLYYVFLVDLGYADGLVSGARNIEEFFSFTMLDHFTHVLLSKELVKKHVHTVLSEMQL